MWGSETACSWFLLDWFCWSYSIPTVCSFPICWTQTTKGKATHIKEGCFFCHMDKSSFNRQSPKEESLLVRVVRGESSILSSALGVSLDVLQPTMIPVALTVDGLYVQLFSSLHQPWQWFFCHLNLDSTGPSANGRINFDQGIELTIHKLNPRLMNLLFKGTFN